MRFGKPIFINSHGKLLYSGVIKDEKCGWHIEEKVSKKDEGSPVLRCTGSPNCPADTRATGSTRMGLNGRIVLFLSLVVFTNDKYISFPIMCESFWEIKYS